MCTLAVVVIVVNSLTLTHYQCTDLGYSFVNDFCYRFIRESLIFAGFSAVVKGIGLYTGQFIRKYTQ